MLEKICINFAQFSLDTTWHWLVGQEQTHLHKHIQELVENNQHYNRWYICPDRAACNVVSPSMRFQPIIYQKNLPRHAQKYSILQFGVNHLFWCITVFCHIMVMSIYYPLDLYGLLIFFGYLFLWLFSRSNNKMEY